MYFEIENTPENVKRKKPEKNPSEDDPVLILKPFSSTPTVSLENVTVNATSTKVLYVQNPKPEVVQVYISKKPDKINLHLSWEENVIGPHESCPLIFSWCPQKPISQRFTLQISDKNKGRYDFFVICKSVTGKKQNQKCTNQNATRKLGIKKSPLKPKPKSPKNRQSYVRNAAEYLRKEVITDRRKVSEYHSYSNSFVSSTVSKNSSCSLQQKNGHSEVRNVESSKNNQYFRNNVENFERPLTSDIDKNLEYWTRNDKFEISNFFTDTTQTLNSTEYFSNDLNSDIRRETYLIPSKNTNTYEKENTIPVQETPIKKHNIQGNNLRNPSISILSAIENLEFTPSKVYNKFVNKDDFKINTFNRCIDIVSESCVNIEIKKEYEHLIEKSPASSDIIFINKTHPIIDLDFSGISKIEMNEVQNHQNIDVVDFRYTVNEFEDHQIDVDKDFLRVPFKNECVLNNSLSSFNPGRCSTEHKKIGPMSKVDISDIPDVSLNDSYKRLSSETYTKGESPTISLCLEDNENKHSSPYTLETLPDCETISNNHCSRSLFVDNMKNYNERLNLKNSVREKNNGSSVKSIIEADLWLKSSPKSPLVSPKPLCVIPEETSMMMSEISVNDTSKRFQSDTFIMNRTYELQNSKVMTNDDVNRKKWSKTVVKDTHNSAVFKIPKTKFDSTIDSNKTNIRILEKSNHSLDIYAMATVVDPFLASTYLYDGEAFNKLENEFKRWLNYLLTPPSDLDTELDIDIGKAWIENRNKIVPAAPTKEQVSAKYHTSHRLDSLRKIAKTLIKSSDISKVFLKVTSQIERKTLSIRTDKNLHLDIGLQKIILNLLMCYNPLWLRIGLEALYDKVIPLQSNDDISGLSNFIIDNMFRDPYVSSKHILIQPSYAENIKKFTLKKFLFLVYFLDQGKQRKMIFHDPCLFRRNAPFKQSKEILFQFTKEVLAGVGDITKHLRPTGYEVKHEQTYLNEFKYAVHNLAVDLRDGVRLTRLMEIILMKKNLTSHLRTPAISRLQKIHNVDIAFTALQYANFEIVGDITSRDIVDGHREKTLSLLWQLIHKFRAPLFENAATRIQSWWRSKYLKIVLEKRIERRKMQKFHNAAVCIQSWWKGVQCRRFITKKIILETNACLILQKNWRMWKQKIRFNNMKRNAIKIQNFYRNHLLIRDAKSQLIHLRRLKAAIKIQEWYRKMKAKKLLEAQNYEREHFLKLKVSVVKLQNIFRAKLLMKKERKTFITMKINTIKIQRYYRSVLKTRLIRKQYLILKSTTLMIQNKFRANMVMKICKNDYNEKRNAILNIQRYYRNYLVMKKQREDFLKLKSAVIYIQNFYRGKLLTRHLSEDYEKQRKSAIAIQRYFKAYYQMKLVRSSFVRQKEAALSIQRKYKALLIMRKERRDYLALKQSTIFIQRFYRSKINMQRERKIYNDQRNAAIKIQNYYRSLLFSRKVRNEFLKQRQLIIYVQRKFRERKAEKEKRLKLLTLNACIKIQKWYRSTTEMIKIRNYYRLLKKTAIEMQRRYRSKISMKIEQENYNKLKSACVCIQRYYRNKKRTDIVRQEYVAKKSIIILLQRRYRACIMMRAERSKFLILKQSVCLIQNRYRSKKLTETVRNQFLTLKSSAILIQRKFRCNQVMKMEREIFLRKKQSAITLQMYIRSYLLMKRDRFIFIRNKTAAITIQRFYRSHTEAKRLRSEFLRIKSSVSTIQKHFRSYLEMKREREKYEKLKEATLKIQYYYRYYVLAREQRRYYLNLVKRVLFIQRKYRAKKLMESEKEMYMNKKRSAITIQRYYRAWMLMKKERACFVEKKSSVVKIQKFYRSFLEMRSIQNDYKKIKASVITVQKFYRSYLKMRQARDRYLELKNASSKIQCYYRNYKISQKERSNYLKFLSTVKFVQRKYRAKMDMKRCRQEYLTMRKNIVTIQTYYRSYLMMKRQRREYLTLLQHVKIVQNRFRNKLLNRRLNMELLNRTNAAVKIQSYVRMCMCKRRFLCIRNSVITIQQCYKRYVEMKSIRCEYLRIRHSVVLIQSVVRRWLVQRRYKAILTAALTIQRKYREKLRERNLRYNLAAVKIQSYWKSYVVRREYIRLKRSVVFCQVYRRSIIQMRIERRKYVLLKMCTVKIQAATRGFLTRKSLKLLSPRRKSLSLRKITNAVIKIQAYWRGYKVRKMQDDNSKIKKLRQRWQKGALNSNQLTLAERNDDALDVLGHFRDVASVIRALKSLDLVTSVYPMMYSSDDTAGRIAKQLTLYMDTSNRSVSTLETLQLGVAILTNLTRYQPTSSFIYNANCVNTILNLLMRWGDKDSILSRSLCTLLWLFGKYEENIKHLSEYLRSGNSYKIMCKIRSAIIRKRRMEGRMRNAQNTPIRRSMTPVKSGMALNSIILPMTEPDYGVLRSTRPKIFQDEVHAIDTVFLRYNLVFNNIDEK